MSHEIDGERAIYAKTPAWHRLGVVKQDGWMTAEECLAVLNPDQAIVSKWTAQATGLVPKLDQDVNSPTFGQQVRDADGNLEWTTITVESEEKVALVEPHPDVPGAYRILSFMDKEYGVVQIVDQFRFLDEVVGKIGGAHYASAARLRKGKQTIVTIDCGQLSLDPNGMDDRIDRYLFGSNSFDGSWAFRVKPNPFRVDCANMAAAALARNAPVDWSTRHTKNIMDRARAAAEVLGFYDSYFDQWTEKAEKLIETPISDNAFTRIVEGLFTSDDPEPLKDKDREAIADIRTIYELSPTVAKIHGTVWGALNSVTEWSDWYCKLRGGKKTDVQEARLRRQMGETDGGLKQAAWDAFNEYADTNPRPTLITV